MISSKDSIVISPQLLGKEASKSAIAREAEQAGTSSGSKAEERKGVEEDSEEIWEEAVSKDEEEAQKAKIKKIPLMPTQAEIDEHCATHVPFRSWCEFCVHGKAKDDPHYKAKKNREIMIPEIAMDYMWLKGKFPFNQGGEGEEGKGQPILIIKDRETKFKQAIMVPNKGVEPYAVKTLTDILARTYGYAKMVLASDQESTIVALKGAVKKLSLIHI